jgi:hypothetical protein
MKRKLRTGAPTEPQNLKRFKTELSVFNKDHTSEWATHQGSGGLRIIQKSGHGPNRKQRRKDERKLKKIRKFAFNQKKPVNQMHFVLSFKMVCFFQFRYTRNYVV